MRPSVDPPTKLEALLAAIPNERLCALVLELAARGKASPRNAKSATASAPATPARPAAKRRRGRPSSKPGAGSNAIAVAVDPKLVARRKHAVEYQRAKRAAAQAGNGGSDTGKSKSGGKSDTETATTFWQRALALHPKAPWRAVAEEFGANNALVLQPGLPQPTSRRPACRRARSNRFLEHAGFHYELDHRAMRPAPVKFWRLTTPACRGGASDGALAFGLQS